MAMETGNYLASMLRNPAMLSTHYHFFELWAIYRLRQGQAFRIKPLGSQTGESPDSRAFSNSLLPLNAAGALALPKADVTSVINAADNEDVAQYKDNQRLIMRAGFPAIDTVEDKWVFSNATTNMSHGLLVQGDRPDSGLIPLVEAMTKALGIDPPRAVVFLWLVEPSKFQHFPIQAHKIPAGKPIPFNIFQYAVEIPLPGLENL